jgi:transposase
LNRLEKVGESLRLALEGVARMAPGWLQARIPAHFEARYTRRIESARLPEGEAARVAWGERTAADGAWLLDQISADPDGAWLARITEVVALQEIWEQECVVDEAGKWHLRAARITEGAAQIVSPSDPEARWSRKRHTEWTGYKVHLSQTCDQDLPHLIVAVHTTPATTPDVAALDDVEGILAANGATAAEHYVDEGYATADAVDKSVRNGIELIGPLALDHSWQAEEGLGYDRDAFRIDWDSQRATCPQGKPSCSWTRREHAGGDGAAIRFHAKDCQPCPARAHCTKSALGGRQIVIGSRTLYEIQLQNRADRNDPDWKRRYNRRAGIEGTISQGVRGFELRHCRYAGLSEPRPASNTS